MLKSTRQVILGAAALFSLGLLAVIPAQGGEVANGVAMNGIAINGIMLNGIAMNGEALRGVNAAAADPTQTDLPAARIGSEFYNSMLSRPRWSNSEGVRSFATRASLQRLEP
ncbi:hypothetical protein ACFQX4_22315 [Roseomonas sp. GCM10028921]